MSKSCVLARHGMSVGADGSLMPCCQFRPSDKSLTFRNYPQWRIKINALAADLDQGVAAPECHQCWHDEQLGYNSLRTVSNLRHQDAVQLNKKKHWPFFDRHTTPWHVEFKLGNFCNLQCIMCSPEYSSSIWAEFSQNKDSYQTVGIAWNPPGGEHRWWETEAFSEFCSKTLPTVRYLHFSGGEPFMVPGLSHILNQVVDPGVVDLLFVTNMTTVKDNVLALIKRFKSVNFAVSLEGTGQHNNYVRFGSDFATIEQNLARVRNIIPNQTRMIVNHTFQHTSIYSLPQLIEWCNLQQLDIHFSLHGGLDYMKINSVPPADVEKFKTQLDQLSMSPETKSYIDQVVDQYCYDPKLNAQYRRYTDMLDSIRGTSFAATFAPSKKSQWPWLGIV